MAEAEQSPDQSGRTSGQPETRGGASGGDSGTNSTLGTVPGSANDGGSPAESSEGFPLRTLADTPVGDDAEDRLGYRDIADGLALLIEGKEAATPLTVALSAPWGAGKTSLLRLVKDRVVRRRAERGEAPAIVVWFNAWMHDAAPNLSAALAADIARHATRCRDPLTRIWHPLPTSMLSPKERARRRFWLAVVALIAAALIYPFVSSWVAPKGGDVTKVRAVFGASAVGWFAVLWGVSVLWPRVRRSVAAVAAFVDDPRSAAATGSMTEVAAQLGELIREAQDGVRRIWAARERPRFVVVIDDLERCQPPKAVDMCEVAAQLLDHPGVITILVGDLRVIAVSAELKYKDAADRFSADADFAVGGWGRFYLQKVVQFELELPPITRERLRHLTRSVPAAAGPGGSEPGIPRPPLRVRLLRSLLPPLVCLALGFAALGFAAFFFPNAGIVVQLVVLGPLWVAALWLTIVLTRLRVAPFSWLYWRRRRISAFRDEVGQLRDNVISDAFDADRYATSSTDLEDEVTRKISAATAEYQAREYWRYAEELVSAEEIHRRLQVRAAADDETLNHAVKAIEGLLPALPRTAKRLLNRLSFLLVVAYNRDLMKLDVVTAERLGKWALLQDQWPDVAKAIIKSPQLAETLENAAENQDEFAKACTDCVPPLVSDQALLRKFFSSDHKLAPAVYHLVYLDANVKAEESPSQPEAASAAPDDGAAVPSATAPEPSLPPPDRPAPPAPTEPLDSKMPVAQ